MNYVQYSAAPIIKAFGGLVKTAEALNLNKQNVFKWKTSKTGLIPRWWSDRIESVAAERGIKLPKPKKVN